MQYVLFVLVLVILVFSLNISRNSVQLILGLNTKKFSGIFPTEFGDYVTFTGSLYMGFDTPSPNYIS